MIGDSIIVDQEVDLETEFLLWGGGSTEVAVPIEDWIAMCPLIPADASAGENH